MKRKIFSALFVLVLALGFSLVAATPVLAATFTSTATGGAWATGTTWVGGTAPTGLATDVVVIATTGANSVTIGATVTQAAGASVTVNSGATLSSNTAGVSVTFGALTINSGGTFTVNRLLTVLGATSITGTINFGSTSTTSRLMTFTGAVTLNSGAVWNETTTGAAATFAFANSFINNATTFTAQNTAHGFSGNTMTLSGATATVLPTVTFTGNYTNSGTLTVATLLTVTGAAIRLTNNGTITATTALSGTGGITQGTTGVLNIGGISATFTLTATAVGNTVNYSGVAQTGKVITYHNLTLSGSLAKTFATTPTVNGILSMEGTATVVATSGVVTYGANATLQYNTTTARTSTAEEWITPFAATGGVIIASTGAITPDLAKVFNASVPLTINSGATLLTNNLQLTFGGNFVNNGTLTAGASIITITGAVAQNIGAFTTTGTVSMTKTAGTATFTGNVNGGALTLNGNGGTLDLGAGLTHTFTGAWTRTTGTLLGNTSTLNIGGTTTNTAGTFTANSSTVNYNAAGAQTIADVTYNNLTLSGSGAKTTTGATVNGILSMEGTATASAAPTYGASAVLQYAGSSTQTTGPELTATIPNLTINNTNGVNLSSSTTISGALTLTSGIINTGANTIIISPTGSVSGGGAGHYINGTLQKYVATGPTTKTFEVGGTYYNPVGVSFNSVGTAGNLTVKSTTGDQPNLGSSSISATKYVKAYWTLTNSGIEFDTCNATFTFDSSDIQGSADPNNFIVGNYSGGWTYPTVGTRTSITTQATGLTAFGDFVVGESAHSTTILIKAQDYTTNVSNITFPQGAPGFTVSTPYNNIDTNTSPQAFGVSKKPVVTLVNTAASSYIIYFNITTFAPDNVVANEYYLINAKGAACTDASAINQTVNFDVDTTTTVPIAATGTDAAKKDLYLKVTLSALAGKSGTSAITILGEAS